MTNVCIDHNWFFGVFFFRRKTNRNCWNKKAKKAFLPNENQIICNNKMVKCTYFAVHRLRIYCPVDVLLAAKWNQVERWKKDSRFFFFFWIERSSKAFTPIIAHNKVIKHFQFFSFSRVKKVAETKWLFHIILIFTVLPGGFNLSRMWIDTVVCVWGSDSELILYKIIYIYIHFMRAQILITAYTERKFKQRKIIKMINSSKDI